MTEVSNSDLVVGLDIGTSKILAVVGEVFDEKVVIRGISFQKTYGVVSGSISDIVQVSVAIKNAISAIEKQSDCKIYSLSVSLSNENIYCESAMGMLPLNGKEVGYKDREKVLKIARDTALVEQSETIIHTIPQSYAIDRQEGITNPVGMTGIRLLVNALVITAPSSILNSVRKCVERTHYNVDNFVYQGLASSHAVLTEDEKRLGVCLVDIGSGSIDIAIYINGVIANVRTIAFGGDMVTQDIAKVLHLSTDVAESFKVQFGSCHSDSIAYNDVAEIAMNHTIKKFPRKDLAQIIEARYEDYFALIKQELKKDFYDRNMGAGIVLTGGGSSVEHIELAAEDYFEMPVRVGFVKNVEMGEGKNLPNLNLKDPQYANVIGLLKTQQQYFFSSQEEASEDPRDNGVQRLKKWFMQYF